MARPMLLIKQELLDLLWDEHATGVPISKLIRKHEIPMTPPTLTKLIHYFTLLDISPKAADKIIRDSLFPDWLKDHTDNIVKQPNTYRYEGKMPLGKWVKNEWDENNA